MMCNLACALHVRESKKRNQYSFAALAPEREGRSASEGYCKKFRFYRLRVFACECLQTRCQGLKKASVPALLQQLERKIRAPILTAFAY